MFVLLPFFEQRLESKETLSVQMPLCPLVSLPIMVDDRNTAQFAELGVNSMSHCVTGSLRSLPVVPTTQVGLEGVARNTDHAACFTGVNVVVEATGIIATASRIQEGTTSTDHGRPDKEQEVWRFRGTYLQRLLKGPTRPNSAQS